MSLDPFDVIALRAMLRLARKRRDADDGEIAVRVGRPPSVVRAALRRLDRQRLVELRGASAPRLTMAGFALAVALLPSGPRASKPARRAPRAA